MMKGQEQERVPAVQNIATSRDGNSSADKTIERETIGTPDGKLRTIPSDSIDALLNLINKWIFIYHLVVCGYEPFPYSHGREINSH